MLQEEEAARRAEAVKKASAEEAARASAGIDNSKRRVQVSKTQNLTSGGAFEQKTRQRMSR
eukprot:1798064-Rhodomonas_salina.1